MAAKSHAADEARRNPAACAARRFFYGAGLLLFGAAAAVTAIRCAAPGMEGMPVPGGSAMSAEMRMPGQTWPGAFAGFLGTWVAMTVAMMLPSLLPSLRRYRGAVLLGDGAHPCRSAVLAGLAYFLVWALLGMAVYPVGVLLAAIQMRLPMPARALPLVAGIVVLLAGALQFTAWKARHLACCRAWPGHGQPLRGGTAAALRYGLRLGLHCSRCCAGATAVLFALGWMDLRAMGVVAAAITVERLAPDDKAGMHAVGLAAVAAGAVLVARAAGAFGSP